MIDETDVSYKTNSRLISVEIGRRCSIFVDQGDSSEQGGTCPPRRPTPNNNFLTQLDQEDSIIFRNTPILHNGARTKIKPCTGKRKRIHSGPAVNTADNLIPTTNDTLSLPATQRAQSADRDDTARTLPSQPSHRCHGTPRALSLRRPARRRAHRESRVRGCEDGEKGHGACDVQGGKEAQESCC